MFCKPNHLKYILQHLYAVVIGMGKKPMQLENINNNIQNIKNQLKEKEQVRQQVK
jgi:hypothetical protein